MGETACFYFLFKKSKHDASSELFCVCVHHWGGLRGLTFCKKRTVQNSIVPTISARGTGFVRRVGFSSRLGIIFPSHGFSVVSPKGRCGDRCDICAVVTGIPHVPARCQAEMVVVTAHRRTIAHHAKPVVLRYNDFLLIFGNLQSYNDPTTPFYVYCCKTHELLSMVVVTTRKGHFVLFWSNHVLFNWTP